MILISLKGDINYCNNHKVPIFQNNCIVKAFKSYEKSYKFAQEDLRISIQAYKNKKG